MCRFTTYIHWYSNGIEGRSVTIVNNTHKYENKGKESEAKTHGKSLEGRHLSVLWFLHWALQSSPVNSLFLLQCHHMKPWSRSFLLVLFTVLKRPPPPPPSFPSSSCRLSQLRYITLTREGMCSCCCFSCCPRHLAILLPIVRPKIQTWGNTLDWRSGGVSPQKEEHCQGELAQHDQFEDLAGCGLDPCGRIAQV